MILFLPSVSVGSQLSKIMLLQAYVLTTRQYDLSPPNQIVRKIAANYCNKKIAGLTTCKANYMLVGGDTTSQYNEVMTKVSKTIN